MPPVNELRCPIRIGARACARMLGAARFDARTAPAPAELLMNVRRDTQRADEFGFCIVASPGCHDTVGANLHTRRYRALVARGQSMDKRAERDTVWFNPGTRG